ncbi:MAG: SpoIIE family protein phosphatase [Crocinitomicaceae bacterium]|nr:SpoIIE family protein phosphatase [Crocinitomicaceae bacterium]
MKFLPLFAAIFLNLIALGQNDYPYGLFNVRNIDRTEYSGGLQNWDMILSDDNLLYFANNGGILEFNGEQWTKFELQNTEHPRSFAKDDNGTIYIGGRNEFGKLVYDDRGKPKSQKLSQKLDSVDFKDIWRVHCIEEKTYFMSKNYIFILDSTGIETLESPNRLSLKTSLKVGNQIIVPISDKDYNVTYALRGNKYFEIQESEHIDVVGGVHEGERHFVIDTKGRFFELLINGNNYKFEPIKRKLQLPEGYAIRNVASRNDMIVAAVSGMGIMIFDFKGNFIRAIGEDEGLANTIVHKSVFDQYNNLWLCTDNGISFVELSSAITKYDKTQGVSAGQTEDLDFIGDTVILATHSDLFYSQVRNNELKFAATSIFGMETWQIRDFTFPDGNTVKLVIGNDGIYSINKNFEKKLHAKYVYAWDLSQSESDPNRIYVGLDGGGIGSLYYQGGEFEYEGNYPNTSGDVRSVIEWNGKVYYTVKYDGVHILDTTRAQAENVLKGLVAHETGQDYEQFTLARFQNRLFVGTVHGLYEVVDNKLVEADIDDCRFCEEDLLIHRIINDKSGKLWIIMFHNSGSDNEEAEFGFLEEENGVLTWNSRQFNQIKDDVVFSVKRAKNGMYWLAAANAVYTFNENVNTDYGKPFHVFISGVYLNEETELLYHIRYSKKEEQYITYDNNTIRFDFGANAYLGGLENEYSYYLEGEEDTWSKWKSTPFVEYQRLREGDYVFHLKARNFYGFESEQTSFAFTITPPWYRTWWAYLIYLALFILLIYIIIRLSIRRVKAQNERLEQIVEERTAEIAEQNMQLEHQKAEIEQKSNDILDSIKYAERIQTAILPTDDTLSEIFEGQYFVLYKPKDIVSGDFYWADRFGSEAIFAAVDCTGHGVPGAFVSIVGFNGLNRTVHEFNLRKPGAILDKLTELVVETFAKSESQIKDGMDIALCNINYETQTLTYSGANNPLILIRNGEIIEIKANKQPIGEFHNRVPFITHEIKLQEGDCIYVYSDGFADQFGGDKGKKFKGKALKQLLLDISTFDMTIQHQKLNVAFEEWKGDFEQLDDVCLFGVKI